MEEFSKGKACGACGVLKSKDEYSKAQWNPKKKTRRCKDCVEQDLPLQHTAKTDNNKFLEEKKEASLLDDSTDNIATGVGSDEKRTEPEEVETNGEANEQENSEETNVENQKSPKDPTATEVPKEQNNSDELSGKGEEQSLAEETYGKKAKTDEDEEKDPKDKSEQSSEDKKPQGDSESQKVDSEEAPAIQTSEDAGEKIITETDEKKEEELGGFVEEVKDEAPTAESPTAGDSTIQTLETPTPSTDAGTFKKTRVSDIASAYLPSSSPSTPPRTSVSKIDIECMPNIGSIREKFELSSRSSDFNIEFGEALRQKIREAQLMDKEKRKEAFSAIRRYKNAFDGIERDDGEIDGSHTQYGEIDESHLPSTFMFEGTSEDHLELHDGTCKVDYENADYNGLIFVVHRTRGMLLLNNHEENDEKKEPTECCVPGGSITEVEFLCAGLQSGNAKMQLQLAAREGAARHLFDQTGIDVRRHLDRLKPAVLRLNPPVDTNGTKYLKNEYENKLFYFLSIAEEDFLVESKKEGIKLKDPVGEPNSRLKLQLPEKYTSFTFIKAPEDAAAFLKRYGDPNANAALTMVMNQADGSEASQATSAGENIVENSSGRMVDAETGVPVGENAVEKPSSRLVDAETGVPVQKSKADFKTETSKKDDIENPKYKHHDEADIKTKTSTDSSVPEVGVTCCCGFW